MTNIFWFKRYQFCYHGSRVVPRKHAWPITQRLMVKVFCYIKNYDLLINGFQVPEIFMKLVWKSKNNDFDFWQTFFGYGNSLNGTAKLVIDLIYGFQCMNLLSEWLSFYGCSITKKTISCSKSLWNVCQDCVTYLCNTFLWS